ncbi:MULTISPECIES: hypothetical protein [Bradyrhizobium]|uniref:hypothetical protein n=1 Tax=Bradyrhizobium TaxID=374 RepID=UPI00155F3CA5|nr:MULTISPECIES: hypothetical protein [Bradyrhizobium]MDD1567173.1 hypothetical protein [Bradyrhizobium sp. WBAH33]NRB90682.1 hypothetical protein [Bradyrhizobium sp. WBAH10]QCJ94470.1 hypothetical protein DAA61_00170 [Bradyrhizobium sp. WBAH33]QCK01835.1 hypothetical protein DAB18_00170 [Bradyrhizobium sp. WBAH41]UUO25811.1 hypothetical protein DCG74_00080 [Bradyrhizobium sp. WBAH42]
MLIDSALRTWQAERRDGRVFSITGERGQIKPYMGELLVVLRQQTSASVVRQLLRAGVLAPSCGGDLKVVRTPNSIESVKLRDLIGAHRVRT